MANRFINPFPQWLDASGNPYAGGSITFYVTQTNTLANVFTDRDLSSAAANPQTLDNAGRAETPLWLDANVTYRCVLKDVDGTVIEDEDPVVDPAANVTAALQVYNGDPNGSVAGNAGTVGGVGASVIFDKTNKLIWVCTTTGSASTAVWTAQGTVQSGSVQWTGIITPSSLASDQNNYNPTGVSTASALRQDASTDIVITGLAGGASGRFMQFRNISTAAKITLRSQSSLSTAANRFSFAGDQVLLPKQSLMLWWDPAEERWRSVGPQINAPTGTPGGRLTLVTGTPVLTSDIENITTVFYTPYIHNYIRLYDGVEWYVVQFSELSQTLADATKSPAAAAVNSVYDMFVWADDGVIRCTRGPAWTSATARGTGAGTTELERVDGVWMNKAAITNGPAARRGVYVGTIATDGSGANGELNMMFAPAPAAGGTNNRLDVWNAYNHIDMSPMSRDNTNTWVYSLTTIRSANNSTLNRITAVFGLDEHIVRVETRAFCLSNANGAQSYTGIGLDSTTVNSALVGEMARGSGDAATKLLTALFNQRPGIGRRFFQMLEWTDALGTTTWAGDDGGTNIQMALIGTFRM